MYEATQVESIGVSDDAVVGWRNKEYVFEEGHFLHSPVNELKGNKQKRPSAFHTGQLINARWGLWFAFYLLNKFIRKSSSVVGIGSRFEKTSLPPFWEWLLISFQHFIFEKIHFFLQYFSQCDGLALTLYISQTQKDTVLK